MSQLLLHSTSSSQYGFIEKLFYVSEACILNFGRMVTIIIVHDLKKSKSLHCDIRQHITYVVWTINN